MIDIGLNMDLGSTFTEFVQVLTVFGPTDGSYKYASVGWPGMYCPFTALNEQGVYLDVHDGSSMGGSVVYEERPSTLNGLVDMMAEVPSLPALVKRLNGVRDSMSVILSLGDETAGGSMERSSLAGNRFRRPEGESHVVVNSFLDPDWGIGLRDTVSNSLRRFDNMTARLAENEGRINAEVTRDLMDLPLFDADGKIMVNGGCTKPTKVDADSTVHQVVSDVKRRQIWLKVPAPSAFADWTRFDLTELWG